VTLVEVVVALALVGVLITLANAGYQDHVRRARRADAARVVLAAAQALERNRSLAGRYDRDRAGTLMAAAGVPNTPPFPEELRAVGSDGAGGATYDLRFLAGPTPTAFTLGAVRRAAGPMDGDACGDLTVDQTGRRAIANATAGASAERCWTRGAP
jgi:type IV pilus assembly protein PilE